LEGWLYEYRASGFAGLHRQSCRDKDQVRALSSEDIQAIVKLRLVAILRQFHRRIQRANPSAFQRRRNAPDCVVDLVARVMKILS
jgi:hypothetical protein